MSGAVPSAIKSDLYMSTSLKIQRFASGSTPLREAFSMSCIANGGSSGLKSHRGSSNVSVARKETLSSAAKSGTEKKKDKPLLEEIKEKEEPPQANDKPPSTPSTPQAPSPSSQPPSPHPLQPQRATHESKGFSPAKRGHSAKRSGGMERSQSTTWESGEENRNKLVKAASTSKLLAKVVKNSEKLVMCLSNISLKQQLLP
ncbi:echinoderm microtubule-associated protein-like 4 isoform X1 [Tachysurus ichikawai]